MPGAGVSSYDKYTYLGGKTRTSLPPSERLEVLSTLMPGHRLLFSKLNSEQIDMVLFLLTGQLPSVKLARAGISNRIELCATLEAKMGTTTTMTRADVRVMLEADEWAVLERKAVARGYKQHTTSAHAQARTDDNSMQEATDVIVSLWPAHKQNSGPLFLTNMVTFVILMQWSLALATLASGLHLCF